MAHRDHDLQISSQCCSYWIHYDVRSHIQCELSACESCLSRTLRNDGLVMQLWQHLFSP
jgi:hypothetical protein